MPCFGSRSGVVSDFRRWSMFGTITSDPPVIEILDLTRLLSPSTAYRTVP